MVCLAEDQSLRGRTQFNYFAYIAPKEKRCYALSEKQKDDCKPCQRWETRLFDQDLSVELDSDRYLYRAVRDATSSSVRAASSS